MQPVIYADLRCLQDQNFQGRGIGYHTAALLRARKFSSLSKSKLIGLTDPRMSELPPAFTSLADEITSSTNPCFNGTPLVFIDGSPMTHDTRFSLSLQNHPQVLNAAVLYDFIPMDWPGYLPTVASRIEYLAKVARLKKFDLFLPISQYTALRTSELLSVPMERISVTGACVRRSLYEVRDAMAPPRSPYEVHEPYFVTFGGDDRRKNTDIAVRAVRHLNLIYGRRIPLKVIGFYSRGYKHELLQIAGHEDGAGFVEFYPSTLEEKVFQAGSTDRWARPSIPDTEVVSLHAEAIAAIAPSHIEGFSLPVAEASVCGCPVLASTCAAHMELVEQPEALFQSDDVAALSDELEALLNEPSLRTSLAESQSHLGPTFHEEEVGKRFWKAIEAALEKRSGAAVISTQTKPRLAFVSPYPPDKADAAVYTAMTMSGGGKYFRADLYTDAERPFATENSFRGAGRISAAPLLDGGCNAIISVLGNPSSHHRVFDFFEQYGGPCILHDIQLAHIYLERLGREAFLIFAANALGRTTSMDEVNTWLNYRNAPPLLLDRIIERASPLIVQTVTQRALIQKQYGAPAHVVTCCPTLYFEESEFNPAAKQALREKYRVPAENFLIATFGRVARSRGMDTYILATELLRSWNIPAELYFIGDARGEASEILRVSTLYDVTAHIHTEADLDSETATREFLIAADAAVQLRTYSFGKLSAAVTNCISAGLPCVTTSDSAASCEAPAFVTTVPDRFSPLQVAEQLALVWEGRSERSIHEDARRAYLQTHNFENYGKRLIEILGVA